MAFSDQLDWNSIAILLHFKKIDSLPAIVNETNVEVTRRNLRVRAHMASEGSC